MDIFHDNICLVLVFECEVNFGSNIRNCNEVLATKKTKTKKKLLDIAGFAEKLNEIKSYSREEVELLKCCA
jgi:hypothetical protein